MPGGPIFGALFFGSLAMAGFTSLLSILQVVSGFQEKFGWTPRQASVRLGVVSAVISVLLFSTTTGLVALDTADQWANNIGIVGSAVLMSVLVLWVLRRGPELRYHLNAVSTFRLGPWWQVLVAVLAPLVLGYMLVSRIVTLVVDGYEGIRLVPRARRVGRDRVHGARRARAHGDALAPQPRRLRPLAAVPAG